MGRRGRATWTLGNKALCHLAIMPFWPSRLSGNYLSASEKQLFVNGFGVSKCEKVGEGLYP
jgi:hypothetical protein